jgi:hypothetical protein
MDDDLTSSTELFRAGSRRLMESLDLDPPRFSMECDSVKEEKRIPRETAKDTEVVVDLGRLASRTKTPMKPGKFDGTGSLESFLAQFEVCCRYNKWTSADKVDFLKVRFGQGSDSTSVGFWGQRGRYV